MPGTPLKRYCTGSAQVNCTACECVTVKKLYFSKAKNNVWTQAEADQSQWEKNELSFENSLQKSARFVLLQEYFLWGWYSWYSDWPRAGLIPCAGKRFFFAPNRSDLL